LLRILKFFHLILIEPSEIFKAKGLLQLKSYIGVEVQRQFYYFNNQNVLYFWLSIPPFYLYILSHFFSHIIFINFPTNQLSNGTLILIISRILHSPLFWISNSFSRFQWQIRTCFSWPHIKLQKTQSKSLELHILDENAGNIWLYNIYNNEICLRDPSNSHHNSIWEQGF
jgi:hypothetical protein